MLLIILQLIHVIVSFKIDQLLPFKYSTLFIKNDTDCKSLGVLDNVNTVCQLVGVIISSIQSYNVGMYNWNHSTDITSKVSNKGQDHVNTFQDTVQSMFFTTDIQLRNTFISFWTDTLSDNVNTVCQLVGVI